MAQKRKVWFIPNPKPDSVIFDIEVFGSLDEVKSKYGGKKPSSWIKRLARSLGFIKSEPELVESVEEESAINPAIFLDVPQMTGTGMSLVDVLTALSDEEHLDAVELIRQVTSNVEPEVDEVQVPGELLKRPCKRPFVAIPELPGLPPLSAIWTKDAKVVMYFATATGMQFCQFWNGFNGPEQVRKACDVLANKYVTLVARITPMTPELRKAYGVVGN